MPANVKWAARVPHVREISLWGTADLAFWRDHLARQALLPTERDGKAQVLIIAGELRFAGVRFRELNLSVLAQDSDAGRTKNPPDSGYLVQSWSSSRTFAFCERTFFSVPQVYGDVRVSASVPAALGLAERGQVVMKVDLGGGPNRQPTSSDAAGWDGPVYLPGQGSATGRAGKMFVSRIVGDGTAYPFIASVDTLSIVPANAALAALVESRFAADRWIVRTDATHAKSKTYRRAEWARRPHPTAE